MTAVLPAPQLTSANGMLSLLDEPDDTLKIHALHQLNQLVDRFWAEIATELPKIEVLYEDEQFKDRNHAALVASKVFYHLEELDDALKYALGAGELFDVSQTTEYVETLIAKCIDSYITQRVRSFEPSHAEEKIDERLISVVERMFERCYRDAKYKQAIGIALESRRLDQLKKAILTSGDVKNLTSYTYHLSQTVVSHRGFRHQVLQTLIDIYRSLEIPDYISMCQCLLFLNDAASVADILHTLVKKGGDDVLMAYQVAFDLNENENQPFLLRVLNALPKVDEPAVTATTTATPTPTPTPAATSTDTATPMDTSESNTATSTATSTSTSTTTSTKPIDTYELRMKRLKSILSGELSTNLYLHFLYEHNHTDLNILKQIKDKLEARNSVTHNATVMAHGFMHVGTTVDTFLRDNLEWLSRAQNWAKFTATASIGVIHKGHHKESLKLLQPYLPSHGQTGTSPYQEGGALYALGLIHANNGGSQSEYLMEALRNAGSNEIVQHGACLGLGLTAMATDNLVIFDILKTIVMQESAVAGEAAGLAMGLVLLGTGNGEALEIMLAYAHETQHEKIIRGLAMGLAMIVYGREEEADVLIEQILTDKDPILRYGAMYAIAMAYVATSNNGAIQKLLHVAVSDVSDDVRRAAVTALGFVLANQPEQVPRVVALLAESYNPHVRYGSCLAVGIACAGTSLKEALSLLEPLLKDRVDFVRQGAFIAMGMVLIQNNEVKEPKIGNLRKAINEAMASKGDTMTKMGAILSAGILDAGGRNVTIALLSPAGHKKMAAIVGLAIFPQFWYWYPEVHFLSLAFTPTALIGLNKDLEIPVPFKVRSNAPPSLYAYPTPIELKTEEKKVEKKKATLSVTAKAAARQKKKDGDDMEVDSTEEKAKTSEDKKTDDKKDTTATTTDDKKDATATATDEKKDETKKEEAKKEPEATYQDLSNPARVTRTQQTVLQVSAEQRYRPVKETLSGIILLRDSTPSEPEQIVVASAPKIGVPGISADEPEPPAPFAFNG